MRDIVINGRFLSRPITGVERYGREILSGFRGRYRVEATRTNGLAGHAWEQVMLPTKLKSDSILWSPANTGPLFVRNQALTIHDLSPLEHPEWFKKSFAAWYRVCLPMLATRARVIFTPSEFVKQKIVARFGVPKVIVTPCGVDTARFHPQAHQTTHALPDPYILFVGSLQPRKNLQALITAWQCLKDEFKTHWLVIAGAEGRVFGNNPFNNAERILWLGYVAEADLPGLYAQARVFVLPAHDEGFGLPVLEAMACGTPVIVSNGGALPETVGAAGLVFDAAKPAELINALRTCLSEWELRQTLQEKGFARVQKFSWQTSSELIWNTLNEI